MTSTLRTPPLLLGAALVFWGWQSGLLLVGALLAVVLEGSRGVGLRWELSEKDLARVWDLCVIGFGAVAVYLFAANEGPRAVAGFFGDTSLATQSRLVLQTAQAGLVLFRWMPMVFFLMVAAQAYSGREQISWSVFSMVLRWRRARRKLPRATEERGVNTAWPYFAVCLFASSVSVRSGDEFFVGLVGLLGWALWGVRSKRFRAATWAGLLAVALGASYGAQRGFLQLAQWANTASAMWLAQFIGGGTDPKESRTVLGRVGRMKLSGKIVLRVEPKAGQAPPALLREASYRFFKFPDWAGLGKARDFALLVAETNQTTWEVAPARTANASVRLVQYLSGHGEDARRGLLAVPHGLVRLENLAAFLLSTNPLGVVRVDEGPGLVVYDAHYDRSGSTIDLPPGREDLTVPNGDDAVLAELVAQLDLMDQSPNEILRRVEAFFREHFTYSLWLGPADSSRTNLSPLADFLLQRRTGHCEYYATAAALLLRKAGVPTRYAVGYAVQERRGRHYVVRQRHAHAWCLVWVDGGWRDFDVTPGAWVEAEAQRAAWWERLADAWWRLGFEWSRLRWGLVNWRQRLFWLLVPVVLGLLGRLLIGKPWRRYRPPQPGRAARALLPGLDSEFYLLERELGRLGFQRAPHETPAEWLERICEHPRVGALDEAIRATVRLHYRYRFDPAGLSGPEREQLRGGVRECLERLRGAEPDRSHTGRSSAPWPPRQA